MKIDFAEIRQTLETLKSRGVDYFGAIQYVEDASNYPARLIDSADDYLSRTSSTMKRISIS